MDKIRKVSIPALSMRAAIAPGTFDDEKRTVDIVFSTGARVLRSRFFSESFHEELSLDKKHVRLKRLNNGAPFLNSHSSWDLRDVLGVIEKATVDGKEGRATVRFSQRDEVQPIIKDIKDGILRSVSVGYRVHEFKEVGRADDDLKILRAVDWEPFEVSAVAMPADDGSKFRSDSQTTNECRFITEDTETPAGEGDPNGDPPVEPERTVETDNDLRNDEPTGDDDMDPKAKEEQKRKLAEAKAEGIKAERERQDGIRSACEKAKMTDEFTRKLLDDEKMSLDAARTAIIDQLAEVDSTRTIHSGDGARIGQDETETFRAGVTEALLNRFRPVAAFVDHRGQKVEMPGTPLTELGRKYRYRTLMELARMCVERTGRNTDMMSKMKIAEFAFRAGLHSTSDFPLILEDIVNKTMRSGYLRAPITWEPFTFETTAPDFKQISRVNMGDGGKLQKVNEHGEFKDVSISENAEKYNVDTYGRIFRITRQALINDDLGAFTTVPERHGRRARDLESDLIWELLTDNANLSDGNALFSSAHSNLSGAAAVPTETGLSEMRQKMRLQVGLDGEVIAIVPRWIYVSPKDETVAEKLLTTVTPNKEGDVSPFAAGGRTALQMAIEPRIEQLAGAGAKPWYGSAEKGQVDMVELARLEGNEGPAIESEMGFEVDGMKVKVRHDVGVKAIDFRGLFKNAGVT